MVSGGMDDPD